MLLTPAFPLVLARREIKKQTFEVVFEKKKTTTNIAKTAFNSNWLETKGMV